ncbi:hypothetical protein [Novosphingobium sp. KACC 22771]|uniref:hypothetical protein n=1 Tax=Novosphingobium sp. KACC 22771 TaxID=3025670 RepID=UPI0023653072|nr:hypothetical protein [Novosphingobium sp. KACC 22771]WDF71684.1 hypothetical protein PQ467_12865 [Novosphingobium sp. KACC 22771]
MMKTTTQSCGSESQTKVGMFCFSEIETIQPPPALHLKMPYMPILAAILVASPVLRGGQIQ